MLVVIREMKNYDSAGRVAQVIRKWTECLCSKSEALNSNASAAKKKKNK
jgi:hypothetical protein